MWDKRLMLISRMKQAVAMQVLESFKELEMGGKEGRNPIR